MHEDSRPNRSPESELAGELALLGGALAKDLTRRPAPGGASALAAFGGLMAELALEAVAAALVPDPDGKPRELLARYGTVRLGLRTLRLPPELIEARAKLALTRYHLIAVAGATGAMPTAEATERYDPAAFLSTLLSPTTRRTARRLLARASRDPGLGRIEVDFIAAYRLGLPAIRQRGQPSVGWEELGSVDLMRIIFLVGLIFFCDCWALHTPAVDVFYLTLLQVGRSRWEREEAEAFREGLARSLLLATSLDVSPADVHELDLSVVLDGRTAESMGPLVLAFWELLQRGLAGFRLETFVRSLTRLAWRIDRDEPTDQHLRKLGRKVVDLSAHQESIGGPAPDPGQLVADAASVRAAVARLSPRERSVLELVARDLPYAEIGQRLGIAPATARVLALRARRALKPVAREIRQPSNSTRRRKR